MPYTGLDTRTARKISLMYHEIEHFCSGRQALFLLYYGPLKVRTGVQQQTVMEGFMEFVVAMVGVFIFGAALRRMQRPTLQRVPVVVRRRVRR